MDCSDFLIIEASQNLNVYDSNEHEEMLTRERTSDFTYMYYESEFAPLNKII